MSGLTLVATPIGNLSDISDRAREALAAADVVYAEDTRHTGKLLQHMGVHARMRSCHDHNERARADEVVRDIEGGLNVALVSDAGTPGIADPGHRVVRAAVAAGLSVTMVPGPSAPIMAVVLSGFATDRFVFDGWLPRRSGQLTTRIESYVEEERTVVLLESKERLVKSLPIFDAVLPGRRLALCRELTKLHEEVRRGTAGELLAGVAQRPVKGEVVLVLEGADS